jgi:hypothetical protein
VHFETNIFLFKKKCPGHGELLCTHLAFVFLFLFNLHNMSSLPRVFKWGILGTGSIAQDFATALQFVPGNTCWTSNQKDPRWQHESMFHNFALFLKGLNWLQLDQGMHRLRTSLVPSSTYPAGSF